MSLLPSPSTLSITKTLYSAVLYGFFSFCYCRRADQQIIGQLDQLVTEQQSTLSQAAVPCFTVTTDPDKIKLQMSVLSLILQLAPNN